MSISKFMNEEDRRLAREFWDKMNASPVDKKPAKERRQTKAKWPIESESLGCHPSQVKDFQRHADLHGFTGVKFNPNGTCEVSDAGTLRRYAKERGFIHRSSYD